MFGHRGFWIGSNFCWVTSSWPALVAKSQGIQASGASILTLLCVPYLCESAGVNHWCINGYGFGFLKKSYRGVGMFTNRTLFGCLHTFGHKMPLWWLKMIFSGRCWAISHLDPTIQIPKFQFSYSFLVFKFRTELIQTFHLCAISPQFHDWILLTIHWQWHKYSNASFCTTLESPNCPSNANQTG